MKKLPTLFSLLAVLFCHALQAGPYYSFEHYTTYDGLPSNTIHCTYQDRFGFVWIGTRDGLSRFDGYDFRSPGGPYGTGMTHLASMDLEEDEDGLLVARRRVGNATFWVKFSRTDGGFLVHRAWSHRMRVEKREG